MFVFEVAWLVLVYFHNEFWSICCDLRQCLIPFMSRYFLRDLKCFYFKKPLKSYCILKVELSSNIGIFWQAAATLCFLNFLLCGFMSLLWPLFSVPMIQVAESKLSDLWLESIFSDDHLPWASVSALNWLCYGPELLIYLLWHLMWRIALWWWLCFLKQHATTFW